MSYLSEKIHPVVALAASADIYDTAQTTDYISLKNYNSCMFVIQHGTGTTGTATITVAKATDAAGTGATNIAFKYRRVAAVGTSDVEGALTDATASGFATTAGSDQLYIIEVNAEEIADGGYSFLALTATEVVNSPVKGAILAILGEARYPGSVSLTAIA